MSSDVPVKDEASEARICVAKIATAHGVKGLVKLHVFVEDSELANGKLFTGETGDETLTLKLKNRAAKHWLAEVDGITDRTDAEKLRGTCFYIDKTALPEPDEDEFYFADLIGLPCVNKDNTQIGKIIATDNFGAGDLLEIQPSNGGESFYLPFNDSTIMSIGRSDIIVEIPEGLIECN